MRTITLHRVRYTHADGLTVKSYTGQVNSGTGYPDRKDRYYFHALGSRGTRTPDTVNRLNPEQDEIWATDDYLPTAQALLASLNKPKLQAKIGALQAILADLENYPFPIPDRR
jgi:hypothetical protein